MERAYRRRSRHCDGCGFSLPFRTEAPEAHDANWSIMPSGQCCDVCRLILDDVVSEMQASYRLAPAHA